MADENTTGLPKHVADFFEAAIAGRHSTVVTNKETEGPDPEALRASILSEWLRDPAAEEFDTYLSEIEKRAVDAEIGALAVHAALTYLKGVRAAVDAIRTDLRKWKALI